MRKVIFQGLISFFLIIGTWCTLTQINWLKLFRINELKHISEQKLGEFIWDAYITDEDINNSKIVNEGLDSIVNHICLSNNLNCENIKLHIINKDEVNAYVLPAGHLVIYSDLIANAKNQDEVTGVICHEIAHIELNHVMTSLVREVGLSVLISTLTGNSSPENIINLINTLTSRAMSRELETEADQQAYEYLSNAEVNPHAFADFLNRLSEEKDNALFSSWLSTHPDSKDRAFNIKKLGDNKGLKEYKSVLHSATWSKIQAEIQDKN